LEVVQIETGGQVNLLADSIFYCLADDHWVWLGPLVGERIDSRDASLGKSDFIQDSQLEAGHLGDQKFHKFWNPIIGRAFWFFSKKLFSNWKHLDPSRRRTVQTGEIANLRWLGVTLTQMKVEPLDKLLKIRWRRATK
jgi:hypothetical protein